MNDIVIMILSTVGALFILVAALGILRMPDFYLRLTVTIKAATFGIGFILVAAALHFGEFSFTTKVFAIIFFLILTAPVGGYMIGKTAYKTGIKLWRQPEFRKTPTTPDELYEDEDQNENDHMHSKIEIKNDGSQQ